VRSQTDDLLDFMADTFGKMLEVRGHHVAFLDSKPGCAKVLNLGGLLARVPLYIKASCVLGNHGTVVLAFGHDGEDGLLLVLTCDARELGSTPFARIILLDARKMEKPLELRVGWPLKRTEVMAYLKGRPEVVSSYTWSPTKEQWSADGQKA
jgi:hypothetical protein